MELLLHPWGTPTSGSRIPPAQGYPLASLMLPGVCCQLPPRRQNRKAMHTETGARRILSNPISSADQRRSILIAADVRSRAELAELANLTSGCAGASALKAVGIIGSAIFAADEPK